MKPIAALVLLVAAAAHAQDKPAVVPAMAPTVTHHTLDLPGRTLVFTATVEATRLQDAKGVPDAEIGVTAYTLDGADPATRPVTFVINGGPGAGSVWMQLGALGPWRVKLDQPSPSMPVATVPNAETWLDFTDLVLLDPPGTGFARVLGGEEARKKYWAVAGDLNGLAEAIRRWLQTHHRMASPKAIAGESYGGFRAPRLARLLPGEQGIAISALVLLSPALDIAAVNRDDVISYAVRLPAMAATQRHATDRAALADVEKYARGEYITDVLAGPRDPTSFPRLVTAVTNVTGLDPALVRRLSGQIGTQTFIHEHDRASNAVDSAYDATIAAPDPFADSPNSYPPDPVLFGLQPVYVSALNALYADKLNIQPDTRYEILNQTVAHAWDWGRGGMPQAINALRTDLAFDPTLRVVIAHGLTDLVTPYFATQLILDALPQIGPPDRLTLLVLRGGHMFYNVDASRAALRDAARVAIVR